MSQKLIALEMLRLLKVAGVSTKKFANTVGLNADSLYSYKSCPSRMTEGKACYIISQIEKHFPNEWVFINEQMRRNNAPPQLEI